MVTPPAGIHRTHCQAVAEFIDSDWGDKVQLRHGVVLPARQATWFENPMPELALSPSHGSMNSAIGKLPIEKHGTNIPD